VCCGTSLPSAGSRSGPLRRGIDYVDSAFLVEHLNLQPVWTLDHDSFPPALAHAVTAVAAGACTSVLVHRSLHNPPGRYHAVTDRRASGYQQWTTPYGFVAPGSMMAMPYLEYQKRYGATRADMATLAMQTRSNVQRIPRAYGTESRWPSTTT
jgi:hypothetical protein